MGCGGGAIDAPPWVALLSMLSRGQGMEWNDLFGPPPLGPTLFLI
jgi:hypothetical protein